ncbi:hypothetical protein [Bacillus licheniformis]|uniref:hypothetical protein n=1 Tax=Bacillus licheniformis TaxID=1402 RepID=UPI0021C62B6E|nr:hypothetical protein [Bacillus licheniformis]
MTFIILMAGLFLLIHLKRPFRRKMFGYVFLAVYLTALALYTINSAFVHFISDSLLSILAAIAVAPAACWLSEAFSGFPLNRIWTNRPYFKTGLQKRSFFSLKLYRPISIKS